MEEKFDAVLSNDALHWMPDQYAVVRRVWNLLKPGGALRRRVRRRGLRARHTRGHEDSADQARHRLQSAQPVKFPELGTFSDILENQGFQVKFIARIDRPTPLVHGLRRWLEVFSASHTDGFTSEQKEAFYKEVEDYCRPMLFSEQNGWTADYVRLRFLAVKPEE